MAREAGVSIAVTLTRAQILTGNTSLEYGYLYLVSAATGPLTLTLPLALSRLGSVVTVRRTDSSANTVILARPGADTLNGVAANLLLSAGQGLTFRSDGLSSNWATAETGFVPVPGTLAVSSRALTGAANLTVALGTQLVVCNNAATAITVILPSAALSAGRTVLLHRDVGSTGAVSINATLSNVQALIGTFAASTTLSALNAYGQNRTYWSDGTNWNLISAG